MATDVERLVVQLSADVKKYENALNRAMGVTNKQTRNIERRFSDMNKNISATFARTLRGTTALVGGGLGVREITQYADAWTEAGNKIRASATAAGVHSRSLQALNKDANEARASLSLYADLYSRIIRSSANVAKSEQEVADVTNAIAKAFKAGGASTQEMEAGLIQIGQALGSGFLQGDELRSIRENAPVVAQAIAKEFDTTISGLKKLGSEGKLTSDRVFKAILAAIPDIQKQFEATNKTIADGFTKVKNNLTEYIGILAQTSGTTEAINTILGALAGNIKSVANAAAAAGVVLLSTFGRGALLASIGALANPFVLLAAAVGAAAYAVSQLWDDVVPLQGSFATLGDYATALWDILSDGAATAKAAVIDAFNAIHDGINDALAGAGTSIEGLWSAIKTGVNTIVDTLVKMGQSVAVAFNSLPAAIGDGVISAMNSMIAGVQAGINKVIHAVNTAIESINSLGGFAGISPIATIGDVDLGEIKNKYAGTGKAAAEAFGEIWASSVKDYVGDAGKAISGSVDAATAAIVARANEVSEARKELELEYRRGKALSTLGDNTAGFGKGTGTSPGGGKKKRVHAVKKTGDDAFAQDIQAIKDRTAALAQEQEGLRMSFYEQQKRETALKLEQRALKDVQEAARKKGDTDWRNAKLSASQISQIDEVADAYARQADELRKAQAQLDLEKDVVKGVFADFRSALEDGKLDWKDFENIALNALDKIVEKIENDLIDAIFSANKAGSSGGGGLLGGILGLFGGSGGLSSTALSAIAGSAGGLFASGGYTGHGGVNQPAGIVHKGEVVWSQADVARAGGVGMAEALRRGAVPARGGGSPGQSIVINAPINAPGADAAQLRRVQDSVKELARNVPKMVDARQKTRELRNTRP